MKLSIQATGISQPDNNKGYLEHAKFAANQCLEHSGVARDEIDLLINVGIYRDNNLCEPSVASLIQHGLGINLNPMKTPVKRPTLSFDIMNGAGGMLNALQVAKAVLQAKQLTRALLVSGDSPPSPKPASDFPITHAGAALLVELSEEQGFDDFTFATTTTFDGQTGHLDLEKHGTQSRFSLQIDRTTDPEQMIGFTSDVIERFLGKQKIDKANVLLIISHPSPSFANVVSDKVGVALASCNATLLDWGDTHTANLALGAHLFFSQKAEQTDLLFVTVGVGLTVGCGLYRM